MSSQILIIEKGTDKGAKSRNIKNEPTKLAKAKYQRNGNRKKLFSFP